MFWESVALAGYLVLNLVIGWHALQAERLEEAPPRWLKPLIYLAIPWAILISAIIGNRVAV